MVKKVSNPEYDQARDTYGTLSKEQKSKVLDRVSQKTDMFSGPVAEQAFIEAVKEIKEETSTLWNYGNFMFGNYEDG